MSQLREILAKNLYELRVASGLTQLGFAEKLNYSDKAVSKWERAESAPDVFMLKRIADFFGVSVDYLLTEEHSASQAPTAVIEGKKRIKSFVSAISVALVWLIATVYFVIHITVIGDAVMPGWLSFVYAVPVSATVALVLNSIWGKRRLNYLFISVIVWSLIVSIHLTLLLVQSYNLWLLYMVGIPAQIIVFLSAGLTGKNKRKKEKADGR